MISPSFLIKKNFKIIILILIITIIFCLIYPYHKLQCVSLIESMEDYDSNTNTSKTEPKKKSGISVPVPSFNVPSGLKLKDNEPDVIRPAKESCPPCPPCARCPEPSFECKKVPRYRNLLINNENQMVSPMVADYTTFGM